ncbi:MAG: lysophospholipid acyltransferase family protein [Litorimonas sp.]
MFKRFMRSNVMKITIGWLVAAYMTLVKYTTRWDVQREDQVKDITGNGKGVIALVWHSRFMMLTAAWKTRFQLPYVLISRSRDGDIVAHTSHFLGLKTIRGSAKKVAKSKTKGGAKAGRDIIGAIEQGGCIVVTPDGPRGPRQRLGSGPLRLARLTGAPLMPCTFAIKNRKQFNSWDKFILPLPFGRGTIIWGTPVFIPEETDDDALEILRLSIETEMNMFLAQADKSAGHEPCLPADIAA